MYGLQIVAVAVLLVIGCVGSSLNTGHGVCLGGNIRKLGFRDYRPVAVEVVAYDRCLHDWQPTAGICLDKSRCVDDASKSARYHFGLHILVG